MLDQDRNRGFLGAWGVSILLHVVFAGVLTDWRAAAGFTPLDARSQADEQRIHLGIERSEASTITWLGFEEPTPHEAPEGSTDQAEFAIGDVAQGGGASPGQMDYPTIDGAIRGAIEERLASLLETILQVSPLVEEEPLRVAEGQAPEATPERAEDVHHHQQAMTPASESRGGGGATTGQQPVDGAGQAEPGDGEPEVAPGNSERESPASARRKPTRIEPGRPAAAEGLQIQTIRPRWTHYTRLTARPENPIIMVHFNAAGRVARAEFQRSTGSRDVDGPLLDAIYAWRASGAALEELAERGEDATIDLEFEIVLRR